jgi:hypothetical protein
MYACFNLGNICSVYTAYFDHRLMDFLSALDAADWQCLKREQFVEHTPQVRCIKPCPPESL